MQPEDVEKCEINFSVVYDYGSAKTIEGSTHILISDQFREELVATMWKRSSY